MATTVASNNPFLQNCVKKKRDMLYFVVQNTNKNYWHVVDFSFVIVKLFVYKVVTATCQDCRYIVVMGSSVLFTDSVL